MERNLSPELMNGSDATPHNPRFARDYATLRRTMIAISERDARLRVEAAEPALLAVDHSFNFSELHGLIERSKPYPSLHAVLLETLDDVELEKYSMGLLGTLEKGVLE